MAPDRRADMAAPCHVHLAYRPGVPIARPLKFGLRGSAQSNCRAGRS
jgi:hypothetical protein